jgi:hypothetical protein
MQFLKEELEEELHLAYIKWSCRPSLESKRLFEAVKEKMAKWQSVYRGQHCDWVYRQEEKGIPIHKSPYKSGPKHPNSYLLYNDSGILVFPRDNADRYSSYAFWLKHITDDEPIESLGQDYFSAKELGISPEKIEELYELQSMLLAKGWTNIDDIERLRVLQEEMQEGLAKFEEAHGIHPSY